MHVERRLSGVIESALSMGWLGPLTVSFVKFHISKLSPRALHTHKRPKIIQPSSQRRSIFGNAGFVHLIEAFHGFLDMEILGQRTLFVRTLGTLYLILSRAPAFNFQHGADLKRDKRIKPFRL